MTPTLPAVAIVERRADGAIVVTPARFLTPERLRAEGSGAQMPVEAPYVPVAAREGQNQERGVR